MRASFAGIDFVSARLGRFRCQAVFREFASWLGALSVVRRVTREQSARFSLLALMRNRSVGNFRVCKV